MNIKEFLDADMAKVEKLIEEYPINVPINKVAEFLEVNGETVRGMVVKGIFGAWGQNTINKRFFVIPTANFVRWYLRIFI